MRLDAPYPDFNRRIVKTIDADGAGAGTAVEEIYVYDGLRKERGNAGDHILLAFDESGDLTDRFMYGPNVDQVLTSEEVASTSTAGDVLWALTDNLGTVRDVAKYDSGTDTTTIVNHLAYSALGEIESETNSAVDFLFAFTGRERDEESDLQYNRARYLEAGRWISEDPLGFDAGDDNLTRYVGNRSLERVDPSGWDERAWPDLPAYDPTTDTGGLPYEDWLKEYLLKYRYHDTANLQDLLATLKTGCIGVAAVVSGYSTMDGFRSSLTEGYWSKAEAEEAIQRKDGKTGDCYLLVVIQFDLVTWDKEKPNPNLYFNKEISKWLINRNKDSFGSEPVNLNNNGLWDVIDRGVVDTGLKKTYVVQGVRRLRHDGQPAIIRQVRLGNFAISISRPGVCFAARSLACRLLRPLRFSSTSPI